MELTQMLAKYRVLPTVNNTKNESLFPIIGALCSGGLPLVCDCVGSDGSYEMLQSASRTFEDILIGAWVTDMGQAEKCCLCGARFVCSPGLSEKIAKLCGDYNVRYIPGCTTPAEIMRAQELGLGIVMIFPAEFFGGKTAVDMYISMFPQIKFIACGASEGFDADEYLDNSRLLAVCSGKLTEGTLDEIAKNSRDFVLKHARG